MLSEGNDDDDDEGDGDAASDYVWRVQLVSGLMLQPLLAFLPRTGMVRRFGFDLNLLTGLATIPCEVLIRPASGWSRRARHRLPAACIDSRGQSGHGARLLDVGACKLPAMGFFFISGRNLPRARALQDLGLRISRLKKFVSWSFSEKDFFEGYADSYIIVTTIIYGFLDYYIATSIQV